ncbi:MAG: efflux RND transporter periplasmic adaptor subunit [Pseudomonadota bacterium]
MKTHSNTVTIFCAVLLSALLLAGKPSEAESLPADGVGALGRIEPRSRIVRVSHDAGPEGARIEELFVAEGRQVKRGDRLAAFSDAPRKKAKLVDAETQTAVLQAKLNAETTKLGFLEKDYKRKKSLLAAQAVSETSFEEIERDLKISEANVALLKAEADSAAAKINLAREELRQSILLAPMDGTVLKIRTRPGERADDRGILELADLSRMDVVAEIYERDMPHVAAGQKAEIRVPGFPEAFHGVVRELGYQVFKNDLNGTDPLADRDNRIVECRISLTEADAEKLQHLLYMKVDVRISP